jgi:hypothetical protein
MAGKFEDDLAMRMGLLPPQDGDGFRNRRGAFKASPEHDPEKRAAAFRKNHAQTKG